MAVDEVVSDGFDISNVIGISYCITPHPSALPTPSPEGKAIMVPAFLIISQHTPLPYAVSFYSVFPRNPFSPRSSRTLP